MLPYGDRDDVSLRLSAVCGAYLLPKAHVVSHRATLGLGGRLIAVGWVVTPALVLQLHLLVQLLVQRRLCLDALRWRLYRLAPLRAVVALRQYGRAAVTERRAMLQRDRDVHPGVSVLVACLRVGRQPTALDRRGGAGRPLLCPACSSARYALVAASQQGVAAELAHGGAILCNALRDLGLVVLLR